MGTISNGYIINWIKPIISNSHSFTQMQIERNVTSTKKGFLVWRITVRPFPSLKKSTIWRILTRPSSNSVQMFHINLPILAFGIVFAHIFGVLGKFNRPGRQNRLAKWVVQNNAAQNISLLSKTHALQIYSATCIFWHHTILSSYAAVQW